MEINLPDVVAEMEAAFAQYEAALTTNHLETLDWGEITVDGKYVNQVFVNRTGPSGSSVCGIAFSPDKDQKYIYIADYGNSRIVILDRKSLKILYQFGTRGAAPGQFQGIHFLAVDSKYNIYAGEVAPGARVQKFNFKGFSAKLPANALTPEQIDALPETTK